MVTCSKCGVENDPDSKFCKSCGSPIGLGQVPPGGFVGPPPSGDFNREMEDFGRRMGEDFKRAGERFGRDMGTRGSEFGVWWDRSLGIFAPVAIALFGIIGFLVAVLVVGGIAQVSDTPAFWNDLVDFMESYWWLFFALAFYAAFQSYLMRRYRETFRWINPVMHGIGFVAWFWIFAQILHLVAVDTDHVRAGDLSNFIKAMLPVLFILVVIVSYAFVFFRMVSPSNWDSDKKA
jgi:hypothetical protein